MLRSYPHSTVLTIKLLLLALFFSGLVTPLYTQAVQTETLGNTIVVLRLDGVIGTHTEDLVKSAVSFAEAQSAILVLELNTPGGLLDSAINIVYIIEDSSVPVVGYVVEKWAVSAGTLILVCTHVAAMQPGTIIGSMQPIQYNPATGTYQPVNESKIINPILKIIEEHAGVKGRNTTVIERFVTENLNLGAYEAKELGVIEIVAKDLNDLISQLNGMTVLLPYKEKTYKIDTANARIIYYQTPMRIRIAAILSDPILSSLLLTFGVIITLFSILSGNFIITPIGILLLLLGLVGSGFNINYTSLGLILIGSALLIVELVTPGFGILGITGIIMIAIGIALSPAGGGYTVSKEYAEKFLYTAYITGGIMGAFAGIAVYKILKVRKREPTIWTIVGKTGKAVEDMEPGKESFVMIEGEYWRAISEDEFIRQGESVIVVEKEGPILKVRRVQSPS